MFKTSKTRNHQTLSLDESDSGKSEFPNFRNPSYPARGQGCQAVPVPSSLQKQPTAKKSPEVTTHVDLDIGQVVLGEKN